MSQRSGRVARHWVLNVVGQLAPMLVGIAVLPRLVEDLGSTRFGLLTLAWLVLGNSGLFDLGMSRATTRHVAQALGRDEVDRVGVIAWTAATIQAVMGLVGALLLAVLGPWFAHRWIEADPAVVTEAANAFALVGLGLPIVMVSMSMRGVLEAGGRFGVVNAVRVPVSIASLVWPWVAAHADMSLGAIVIGLIVIRVGALVAHTRCATAVSASVRTVGFDREAARQLVRFGSWATVSNVAGPIMATFERVLISALISPAALAIYAAPLEVLQRMLILPSSLASALFPAVSARTGDRDPTGALLTRPLKSLAAVLVPPALLAAYYAHDLIAVWLGEESAAAGGLAVSLMSFAMLANGLAHVPYAVVHGLGRPRAKAVLDVLELPLFVGMCFAVIPAWGVAGAAACKLAISVVDLGGLLFAACRYGASPLGAVGRALGRIALLSAGFALSLTIARGLGTPTAEAGCVLVACFAWVVGFVTLVLDDEEAAVVRRLGASVIAPLTRKVR